MTDHQVEEIRAALDYDPDTGVFRWKRNVSPKMRIGSAAGTMMGDGYIAITVNRRRYAAHRLAWLHVHGELPTSPIDHINGDRSDNKLANLRLATNSQNAVNRRLRADNVTGLRGVYVDSATGQYRACIGINRKTYQLGRFNTPEEAKAAYDAKAHELHGEFARA